LKQIGRHYVEDYNTVRLHSVLGYITPIDQMEGRAEAIFAERRRKLSEARTSPLAGSQALTRGHRDCARVTDDSLTPTRQNSDLR
jgi:hypothetical protein